MKNKYGLKFITLLIPIIIIILFIEHKYIQSFLPLLPTCIFFNTFDLYCPACGNTRSVTALLQGDILTSLRYNIIPLLLSLLLFLGYIELATYSFGKYKRILPRKLSFYLIGIALIVLYLIIRNFIPYLTP
ncbi:MAG: hypothetical protein K0S01_1536 [Herbinix sp.]|jgi:hypothetical protein|nr:hypothetical protein [Herbinix sp.]